MINTNNETIQEGKLAEYLTERGLSIITLDEELYRQALITESLRPISGLDYLQCNVSERLYQAIYLSLSSRNIIDTQNFNQLVDLGNANLQERFRILQEIIMRTSTKVFLGVNARNIHPSVLPLFWDEIASKLDDSPFSLEGNFLLAIANSQVPYSFQPHTLDLYHPPAFTFEELS